MLISLRTAAYELGVSVETLRAWAEAGHVASYRTPANQREFDSDEIAAYAESLRPTAPDDGVARPKPDIAPVDRRDHRDRWPRTA